MSPSKKKILITGGAGFIGSHLADRFAGRGYQVFAVDNFITGSLSNVRHLSRNRDFKLIHHDISKPLSFPGSLDAVLHFASPASPPDYMKYPLQTLLAGSQGTHHSLEIARAKKAVFMMASTSEVYGDPLENPQAESYWGHVNPSGPRSVYDEAKRYSEAVTMAYHRYHGVDTKIVRIFNTYGPRMRPQDGRVIPNFISQALLGKPLTVYGDGKQVRDVLFVDDLMRLFQRLIERPGAASGEVFNVGGCPHNQLGVVELIGMLSELGGQPIPYDRAPWRPGDQRVYVSDVGKVAQTTGWAPEVSPTDGIKRLHEWVREHVGVLAAWRAC